WFLGRAETSPIKERGGAVATVNDLLVFFGRARPENELDEAQFTESLIEARKRQLDQTQPRDAAGLERFREQFGEAFRYSLMAEFPSPKDLIAGASPAIDAKEKSIETLAISRRGKSDRVSITLYKSGAERSGASFALLIASNDAMRETQGLIE